MLFKKLSELATIDISNVDKKTKTGEQEVKLCNFVDVYHKWALKDSMVNELMSATANENQISRFKLHSGQVAITKDSETKDDIGMAMLVDINMPDVVLGYHCALITPNGNELSASYLNVVLHSSYASKYFEMNASGSGQRYTLTNDIIGNFPVPMISLKEQKSISGVFDQINNKILTNNAIISELESMVKDIYDYWFVQFDFPDENGKPYKSSGGKMVWNEELKREIPEGWSNCTLEKLVNIVRGVTYEEGDTVDRPDKDHIMLLRANNIANEKINLDKVTFVSKDRVSAQQILIPGDILICMSSGSKEHVGKTAELPFDEKMTFGAFCSKIRCNDDIFRPFVNRTIKSNLFNAWVKQKALGTNINNLTNEIISSMPIVYPTKQIISRFHTLLCPIISKIYSVAKESRELTSLRDFLLPLLMNGQVKIGDVSD